MPDRPVKEELRKFVDERDWGQFHSPENLIKSVAIESGELLECVQWGGDPDPARIQEELADVLTYCYLLADKMGWNPESIVIEKLAQTRRKYPIEESRGRSTKYDEL